MFPPRQGWVEVFPMSNSSAHPPHVDAIESLRAGVDRFLVPVRFVGFWLAVVLPLVYLPLLVGGLAAPETTVFVVLLALNILSLFAGHGYAR